jgi:hypothetical protein
MGQYQAANRAIYLMTKKLIAELMMMRTETENLFAALCSRSFVEA